MRLIQTSSLLPSVLATCVCMVSLTLASCGGSAPPAAQTQSAGVAATGVTPTAANGITPGAWGGNTIALTVTSTGATLIMDCAIAQVLQPIVPNAQGEFSVPGQVRVEGGGPVTSATFQGTLAGDQMQIAVFYRDAQGQVENWQDELTFGHDGPVAPVCPLAA